MNGDRCPSCRGVRSPLFWSKAGMTYQLCEKHKLEARAARRAAVRVEERG